MQLSVTRRQKFGMLYLGLALSFLCSLSVILPISSFHGGTMVSPDETAAKLFTQLYADTGKLYYEKDYLALDSENLLHPRVVLTYNGRAVYSEFLGLPIIYSTAYLSLGEYLEILSIVFAIIIFVYLLKIYRLVFNRHLKLYPMVIISCIPLIFYLNMPYFEIAITTAFSVAGAYYMIKYAKQSSRRIDVGLGSLFFAVAFFCRYDYFVFITLFTLILILQKHHRFGKKLCTDLAIYSLGTLLIFVLPVLLLNDQYYGNPLRIGHSLFYTILQPERVGDNGGSLLSLTGIRLILFPEGIQPGRVISNVGKYWFMLMPLYSALAIWGCAAYLRHRRAMNRYTLMYVALGFYVLFSGGGGETWGYELSYPIMTGTVLRRWLPLFIAATPFVAWGIGENRGVMWRYLTPLLVVVLLVTSLTTLIAPGKAGLYEMVELKTHGSDIARRISDLTEENAIIYCSASDKYLLGTRDVATWWAQSERYDPTAIANSMSRVKQAGYPVYLIAEGFYVSIEELNSELLRYELVSIDTKLKLYRLEKYSSSPER